MALSAPQETAAPRSAATLGELQDVRATTLALVAHLGDAQLERTYTSLMSPLVWDLAHIAAYEDLWLAHRHAGLRLLHPELAEMYDAFETPRAARGEIELLDAPAARGYLRDVRERVLAALTAEGIGDGVLCELVLRHELQHTETMRQAMAIAGILPAGEPRLEPLADSARVADSARLVDSARVADSARHENAGELSEWVEVAAGAFEMGASAEGFAYDNERPRHTVETDAFGIARWPVTNASWLEFVAEGGYERRELWCAEGWAWKAREAAGPHEAVAFGDPRAPVCHVSWFEADAFARAHAARLPTEAEWERAARENALEATGRVWEWTSSFFGGYPGFVAYPYREYSEVFFGEAYRVLRGGSWASSARVATKTFRNWDYPQRRQIFAGVRLAHDSEVT